MQKNKIKILNQKVSSLKEEISSLKLLMSHLKQKHLLSKETHDNIVVNINKFFTSEIPLIL